MNTQREMAMHTTGSKRLGTEETYEVIPLLAAPLPVTFIPARMELFLRTALWLVTPEPKETSVSLAGFQVSTPPCLESMPKSLLARDPNYTVNCFSPSLFYFKCQSFSHYSDTLK